MSKFPFEDAERFFEDCRRGDQVDFLLKDQLDDLKWLAAVDERANPYVGIRDDAEHYRLRCSVRYSWNGAVDCLVDLFIGHVAAPNLCFALQALLAYLRLPLAVERVIALAVEVGRRVAKSTTTPDPGIALNCPLSGAPLTYVRTDDQTHVFPLSDAWAGWPDGIRPYNARHSVMMDAREALESTRDREVEGKAETVVDRVNRIINDILI